MYPFNIEIFLYWALLLGFRLRCVGIEIMNKTSWTYSIKGFRLPRSGGVEEGTADASMMIGQCSLYYTKFYVVVSGYSLYYSTVSTRDIMYSGIDDLKICKAQRNCQKQEEFSFPLFRQCRTKYRTIYY